MRTVFDDRTTAGERLATELQRRGIEADFVLGIPRGALPVARPVADALEAQLDVVVAQKIGAPRNPELALGAAASDGSVWLNDDLIDHLGVPDSYLEREREREAENAREKASQYRPDTRRDLPTLTGKRVVVVDDGVATGATAIACLRQMRDSGAAEVVLAVPVGSPDSLEALEREADDVVSLVRPADFRAVGQYYRDFGQVSDEEAIALLEE